MAEGSSVQQSKRTPQGRRDDAAACEKNQYLRRKLIDLVSEHLTDLDAVHAQLCKDKGTPQCETVLRFLSNTLGDVSLEFTSTDIPNSTHLLLLWLLMRLFRLLGSSKCRSLHELATTCVSEVYHLCSRKVTKWFVLMCKELAEMLTVLAAILSGGAQYLTESSHGLCLSHFSYTAKQGTLPRGNEDVLEAKLIELHSIPDCSYLVVAALSVLCDVAEKVNLFAREVTGAVVQSLGTFLKHGSAVVKRSAIDAMKCFLTSGWSVAFNVVDRYISGVVATAEFHVLHHTEDSRHILAVMESSLAHFLTWFFTSSCFVQPCHWARLSSLLHLMLAGNITLSLSEQFQDCLSTLLNCYIQHHAPQGSLVELGKAAFSLLGRLPSLQCVVPTLVKVCQMEKSASPLPLAEFSVSSSSDIKTHLIVKRCAAKRVKTIALSKETKTPHSASSLLVQANSAMAPPSVGGAFTMKLGQQAVAMAKALTNQLACQVGESGVLTWKEGINWNEVMCLLEGVRVVLETQCRVLALSTPHAHPQHWCTNERMSTLCAAWEWTAAAAAAAMATQPPGELDQILSKIYQCIGALYLSSLWGKVQLSSVMVDRCNSLLTLCWRGMLAGPRSGIVGGTILPREVRSRMTEILKSSKADLTTAQSCSMLATSAFPSSVAPLQRITMTTEALAPRACDAVQGTAIRCLPLWITCEDTSLHSHLTKWLRSLLDRFTELSVEVCVELCTSAGSIMAAVCPPGVVRVVHAHQWDTPFHQVSSIEIRKRATVSVQGHSDMRASVSRWVVELCEQAGLHVEEGVKIAFLEGLGLVCQCVIPSDMFLLREQVWKYLADSNPHVLKTLGHQLRFLLPKGTDEHIGSQLVKELRQAYQHHLTTASAGSYSTRVAIVCCFADLARCSTDNGLLFTVVMEMIKLFEDPSEPVRVAILKQLRDVVCCHGYTPSILFDRLRQPLTEYLAERIHQNPRKILSKEKPSHLLQKILVLFEYGKVATLLEASLQCLYPKLVYLCSKSPSPALDELASFTETESKTLLVMQFKYVFAHLICRCDPAQLTTALQFLEDVLQVNVATVLKSDPYSVMNELAVCIALDPERVKNGMLMVVQASKDSSAEGGEAAKGGVAEKVGRTTEIDRDKMIVDFIKPQLLGVFSMLNSRLLMASKQKNEELASLAVCSLTEIVELMGADQVTPVRVKVMGMVKLAVQFPSQKVVKEGCHAWSSLIRSIHLECLGPMLSQVIVTLSPLLDKCPQQVADIFQFLMVENRSALCEYFGEVYNIPDHPLLSEVNSVFKEYTVQQQDFWGQLGHILKGLTHEQTAVRLDALEHLVHLLQRHWSTLSDSVVGSDRVEPVLSELITTLMRCSRDADPDVRVKIAECLGELGAIDPGRLDLSAVAKDTKPIRMYEIDDPSGRFAVNLLQELARAFLAAADTRGQDCCAFAIQEVLLVFQCASADETSLGCIIWNSLPPESQAILRPYLRSQYTTQGSTLQARKIPIYRPSRVLTSKDWITHWLNHMIGKVLQQKARRIFDVCALTFKYDHQLALFLLPHIVCCVLRQEGNTDTMEISVEIMAVIGHACQLKPLTKESADHLSHNTQTIFSLLDHLKHWVQNKLRAAATQRALHGRSSASKQPQDPDIDLVRNFLDSLPKNKLAQAAFNSKSYARGLMYMEDHLRQYRKDMQCALGFLQRIYVALDEPDGVAGLSALRKGDASVKEKILEHESSGQFSDATSYYNLAIKKEPNELAHYEGLLLCNMEMGYQSSVLMHVSGLTEKHPEWTKSLNAVRVEAAWRLGKWDELENYLAHDHTTGNWSIGLGRVLLAAKQKNETLFQTQLRQVRSEQMGPLSASSMEVGSYKRSYEFIVRLHMLKELEEGVQTLLGMGGQGGKQTKKELLSHWGRRLEATQTSYLTREPILSLRRLLYGLANTEMSSELGQSWLESTAMARRSWLLETAGNYLRMAEMHPVPGLHLEQAKILHGKGDTHQALMDLQRAVRDHFPVDVQESAGQKDADVHAKALLYIGRWMEETAHYETQTILKQYKSVIAVHPQSESGHFYLATYYERLMNVYAAGKTSKSAETQFLPFVVRHYGNTLRYGNKFIYQSIPRLLTLWLDFGASLPDTGGSRSQPSDRPSLSKTLEQLNAVMAELLDQLPPYQFLIVFSQLISRVCHPNGEVFMLIQAIILKLIKHYPQQSLWMMMAVVKSTHKDRQSRCQRILSKAKSSNSAVEKQITDMMKLTDGLLTVSNKAVENQRGSVIASMDKLCRGLSRLTSDKEFSSIIVPNQSSLTVTLPMDGGGPYGNLNPFPGNLPTIVRFEDKVEVLASLVRPKKITILASDGQKYVMMCKPEDDLRKDSRLMELFTVINKCLRKDPESRRRALHIRTYSVVPLNEKCGLIEWVPNTSGLRNILNSLYQEKGAFLTGQEIRELWRLKMSNPTTMKENFEKHVLTRYPPVFSEWFRKTFPDPTQWYSSQVAYSRTAAVMSIVGYILGLGDRHGENILFDSTNGDCVHVDFNCLFNRGRTFEVPECVPFRLTHNMIDAMGVAGYEGVFRKSCEVTMRVLREQCDPLVCILKTFVHDPLVEWKKQKGPPESIQETAVTIIKDIEDRISGKGSKSKVPPLSITGQVHQLILEATDLGNLSRMYIGWAAYL